MALVVYDDTSLQFSSASPRIRPDILKPNDIIVARCYMRLRANPDRGAAKFYLSVDEIRLVHVAADSSTTIV